MPSEMPPNGDAPQPQTKKYSALNIGMIALSIVCLLLVAGLVVCLTSTDILGQASANILIESYLKTQCQDRNPDFSSDACADWLRWLKSDHVDDYKACVEVRNNTGRPVELKGLYDCFVDKGLGPQE